MDATEVLVNEHVVIKQVLTCLERLAAEAQHDSRLDGMMARMALDFFRIFADHCHHRKEEVCLVPLLEARGFPRDAGPTGVMLREHEEGRRHLQGMNSVLERAEAGESSAVQDFCRHAQDYVVLLRQHITKENHCLFPMAKRVLTPADQQRLLEAFGRLEGSDMPARAHERMLEVARCLADHYDDSTTSNPTGFGCCHATGS